MISIGISYAGFDKKRQASINGVTNKERFKAHYVLPPVTVAAVYNDLQDEYDAIVMKDL